MFVTFIRTILMYFFVIFSLRLLGKRQIGELEPSELVVTIIISEVAALPIQDPSQPIISSLLVISLLVILEIILSFGAYRKPFIRKFFYGVPSIFYQKGKLCQKEMERQRFNLNDLMSTVRNTGITNLSEVDYIIMETNGNISVIPKPEHSPLTLSDLNIESSTEVLLSYIIIDNGKPNFNNLEKLGYNEQWLNTQLKSRGFRHPTQIFCMTADSSGELIIIPRDKKKE